MKGQVTYYTQKILCQVINRLLTSCTKCCPPSTNTSSNNYTPLSPSPLLLTKYIRLNRSCRLYSTSLFMFLSHSYISFLSSHTNSVSIYSKRISIIKCTLKTIHMFKTIKRVIYSITKIKILNKMTLTTIFIKVKISMDLMKIILLKKYEIIKIIIVNIKDLKTNQIVI